MAGLKSLNIDPKILDLLARMGQGGDTELAHLTPGELVVPESVQDPELMEQMQQEFSEEDLPMPRYMVRDSAGDPNDQRENAPPRANSSTGLQQFFGSGDVGNNAGRGGSDDDGSGPSAGGGVSPGGGNTGGRAGPTGNEATGPGDVGGAAPGGDGNGGYGQNMGRAGSTPGTDPDTSPAPDVTGISTGQSPFGALGQPNVTSSNDMTTRANAASSEAAASQHAAATEHGIAADMGRYGVVTRGDVVDQVVGSAFPGIPGVSTPGAMRSAAKFAGNNITGAIEDAFDVEAEMGVGEVGSADPSNPGIGPGAPGGGDGGGDATVLGGSGDDGSGDDGDDTTGPAGDTGDDAGNAIPENWNEQQFLADNPEVASAVDTGHWRSGYDFNNAFRDMAGQDYGTAPQDGRAADAYRYADDLLEIGQAEALPWQGYDPAGGRDIYRQNFAGGGYVMPRNNPATGLQQFADPWGDVSSSQVENIMRQNTGFSGEAGGGAVTQAWQNASPSQKQAVQSAIDAQNASGGSSGGGGGNGGNGGGNTGGNNYFDWQSAENVGAAEVEQVFRNRTGFSGEAGGGDIQQIWQNMSPGEKQSISNRLSDINTARAGGNNQPVNEGYGPWEHITNQDVEDIVRDHTAYTGGTGQGQMSAYWQNLGSGTRQDIKSDIVGLNESRALLGEDTVPDYPTPGIGLPEYSDDFGGSPGGSGGYGGSSGSGGLPDLGGNPPPSQNTPSPEPDFTTPDGPSDHLNQPFGAPGYQQTNIDSAPTIISSGHFTESYPVQNYANDLEAPWSGSYNADQAEQATDSNLGAHRQEQGYGTDGALYGADGGEHDFFPNYDFPYSDPSLDNDAAHGGYVAGPGDGNDDRVPANLSDGEFVMTADAVQGLGGGDRMEGARRMYEIMRMLENGRAA